MSSSKHKNPLTVMKIIVVENENNNSVIKTQNNEPQKSSFPYILYTLPDTTLRKNHRPFFIPDFANPCVIQLYLVVRLNRLGRFISQRFAHRYYDAITVGTTFTAENLLRQQILNGRPWDIAKGFDGAAAIGEFISLDDDNISKMEQITLSLQVGDLITHNTVLRNIKEQIDSTIANISQFYTLKQGDYLFFECATTPVQVKQDTHVNGYMNSESLLSFNIK